MNRREIIKLFSLAMLINPASKLFSFQDGNKEIYAELVRKIVKEGWINLSLNHLMEKIAFEFLGNPYAGGTLDIYETEKCSVYFDKFDCVTFFETVLCMAKTLKRGKSDYTDLLNQIQMTRYRSQVIENYTSRLHYTADWIYFNKRKKNIRDITKDLGGTKINFKTSFMSSNPDKYKALKQHPEYIPIIKSQEETINQRLYYYISKDKLNKNIPGINTCDIIAITTSIEGLDYSHIGFAFKDKDNNIRFLHASSSKKKVVLDTYLSDYLANIRKDTGITVLRPI